MEEREVVHKLVDGVFPLLPILPVLPDEPALLQLLELRREPARVGQPRCLEELRPLHPRLPGPERLDDGHVSFGPLEQRAEQIAKLVLERGVFSKEGLVDVLGEAQVPTQEGPVVGNTPHDHVALEELVAVHDDPTRRRVFRALGQGEGHQVDLGGQPIVEPSLVVDDLAQHPGGGRPAYDKHYVLASGRPAVPEALQGGHQVASPGIHPGELVDEYDFPLGVGFQDEVLQQLERLEPVGRAVEVLQAALFQGCFEREELALRARVGIAGMLEGEVSREGFPDQVRFPNAPPSEHGDELRLVRLEGGFQELPLLIAGNEHAYSYPILICLMLIIWHVLAFIDFFICLILSISRDRAITLALRSLVPTA